ATLGTAVAKQTWPASSTQDAGRCCVENSLFRRQTGIHRPLRLMTDQARILAAIGGRMPLFRCARRLWKNSRACCSIGMESSFAVCLSGRASRLVGMNWVEFIADGKRAARFAAVTLSGVWAAN